MYILSRNSMACQKQKYRSSLVWEFLPKKQRLFGNNLFSCPITIMWLARNYKWTRLPLRNLLQWEGSIKTCEEQKIFKCVTKNWSPLCSLQERIFADQTLYSASSHDWHNERHDPEEYIEGADHMNENNHFCHSRLMSFVSSCSAHNDGSST